MKRKICSPYDSLVCLFDDDELEVSETLLQVPRIIFESQNRNRFLFTWGVRKKRSVIRPSLSMGSAPTGICKDPICDDNGPTANASTESDDRSKSSRTSVSYQKEEEDWLKMVEGLTHGKELMKISSVEPTLRDINTELKAKKQQLSVYIETETGGARVESRERAHSQRQAVAAALPLLLKQPPFGSKMCGGQINALVPSDGGPEMTNNYMGRSPPRSIPDLNVSPEEDLSPPPDLNLNIALMADSTQLKRITTAQARKRRLQIYRVKKAKGLPHTNRFLKLGLSVTNMVF